jgi:hypothetical protein
VRVGDAVLRYQTPGCGELVSLESGVAHLGCPPRPELWRHGQDSRVELALDTPRAEGGFEQTRVRLGDTQLTVCLLRACAVAGDLRLWATPGGHALELHTSRPVAVDSHDVVLELARGSLRLETRERGGGAFRADQWLRVEADGELAARDGRLLLAASGDSFVTTRDERFRANVGTTVELVVGTGSAAARWTEVGGDARRADELDLQRRLDAGGVAPSEAEAQDLLAAARGMAERAFKTTVRWLRPRGTLLERSRRTSALGPGLELVTVELERRGEGEQEPVLDGGITVVGLMADTGAFTAALRSPCNEARGVASINGFEFRVGSTGHVLPEAGLVLDGQVLGSIRTDPWYSNLLVDEQGRISIEDARAFYERGGLDGSVVHLLQGTTYLRQGRSMRRDGDNPEVNWRSAVGVGRPGGRERLILAHTLVPTTRVAALTAYGRGLTQAEMADLLSSFGAEDAVVLDGGPSAAMAVGGRLVSGGLRGLPVCLTLEPR